MTLLLLVNDEIVSALPMFQLHVPAMVTPETFSRSTINTVRSANRQHAIGLFSDASPVFKFVNEQHNGIGQAIEVPQIRKMDFLFRMQYLNSYLGYNMVNSKFSQLSMQ